MGDWKLVPKRPNTSDYALYNLSHNRCERVNLAGSNPDRVAFTAQRWQAIEASFRALATKDLRPK